MAALAKEYWLISLTTSLVIVFLLALTPLWGKRYGARWQYAAWLFIACRLLVPYVPRLPYFLLPGTAATLPPAAAVVNPLPAAMDHVISAASAATVMQTGTAPVTGGMDAAGMLGLLWLLGAAVFLLYQVAVSFVFHRQVKKTARPVAAKTREICLKLQKELGIAKNIEIKTVSWVSGPLLFGLFRPTILLPEENINPSLLHFVFKHELCHYRHGDLWWKLLLLLANALHWYNPLVYLAVCRAGQACELSCDQSVVRGKDRSYRQAYGQTVLSLIRRSCHCQAPVSTYFFNGKRSLEERLRGMLDMGNKKTGVLFLTFLLLTAVILTACVVPGKDNAQEISDTGGDGDLPAWCTPMSDFSAMAAAKTPYVGNASAVGKVLSFSPLKSYNYTGMSLQTVAEPYGITLNYIIAQPNLFTQEEIAAMAYLTAMNCFVLIDNVGTVVISVENYYTEDDKIEPLHRRDSYAYDRACFDADYGRDVREFADDPTLWRQAVKSYIKNGIKPPWNTWRQDQAELAELQKEVDNGHKPGLLDPAQVGRQFVDQLDMLKSSIVSPISRMEVISDTSDAKIYSYIRENGTATQVLLTQPVQKGEAGIWQVLYYRELKLDS